VNSKPIKGAMTLHQTDSM